MRGPDAGCPRWAPALPSTTSCVPRLRHNLLFVHVLCCRGTVPLSRYPFLLRDESRSWLGLQHGLVVGCLCLPRWVNGEG